MIASPHNDRDCLGAVTEQVAAMMEDGEPHLAELAERFDNLDELAAWIRSLPQRDDHGLPSDGPKVNACRPVQRFRIDALDPNCLERTGKFVGVAEQIDPSPVYRMATVSTPSGLHTIPTVNGRPVVLDPRQTRNALAAGLFLACPERSRRIVTTPSQAVDWIGDLAREPAAKFAAGERRVDNGHRALRGVLAGRPLCVGDLRDAIFVLALGEREARLYGPIGIRIVHTVAHAIDRLDRAAADSSLAETTAPRNVALFGLPLLSTAILGAIAKVGGRIAGNVGLEALKLKLASMGLTPPVLNTLEGELNREGLTLGPLSAPPAQLGTLAAMDPVALAGRRLADKINF